MRTAARPVTIQYPSEVASTAAAAIPSGRRPAAEPWNVAAPNVNTPPSRASSRYPAAPGAPPAPCPSTTGSLRRMLPVLPWKVASPKVKTPPSRAKSQ